MLSDHSKKRDGHGLPIVNSDRKEYVGFVDDSDSMDGRRKANLWNAEHKQLECLTEDARNPIEDINFIQRWMMPHLHLHDYSATPSLARTVIDPSKDKSIQEEVDLLTQIAKAATIRREELVRASAVLLEHVVSDIFDKISPRTPSENLSSPPQGLLRVWGAKSHTKYDERLGFRCSSSAKCGPASTFEELKQRSNFSVRNLKSHCENEALASDWISLSGEPSWMLKHIDKHWPTDGVEADSMNIALISTAKMERMRLLFDRSDLLLKCAGGRPYRSTNPDGVKFTWPSHYLVYGWIPVQCIVTNFTLARFRDVCKGRNIRPDDIESIDPFTLLDKDPDASIGSIQQRLESLGI